MSDWIDFDDKLPEDGKLLLIYDYISMTRGFGFYKEELHELTTASIDEIPPDFHGTHWQYYPEAPNDY